MRRTPLPIRCCLLFMAIESIALGYAEAYRIVGTALHRNTIRAACRMEQRAYLTAGVIL
jgi:hypothetical protein